MSAWKTILYVGWILTAALTTLLAIILVIFTWLLHLLLFLGGGIEWALGIMEVMTNHFNDAIKMEDEG